MNETTKKNERNEKTGQFAHKLEAMCRCGKTKGEHTAAAPYIIDNGDEQCPGFKKVKVSK